MMALWWYFDPVHQVHLIKNRSITYMSEVCVPNPECAYEATDKVPLVPELLKGSWGPRASLLSWWDATRICSSNLLFVFLAVWWKPYYGLYIPCGEPSSRGRGSRSQTSRCPPSKTMAMSRRRSHPHNPLDLLDPWSDSSVGWEMRLAEVWLKRNKNQYLMLKSLPLILSM